MKERTAQEKQNCQFDLSFATKHHKLPKNPQQITKFILNKYEILGGVKSETKITYVFLVWICFGCFPWICRGAGGCPNNPDAAIREKVSKKAMVVTGSLNQPALLTSSRATLSRKSSTCESTCNPQRC